LLVTAETHAAKPALPVPNVSFVVIAPSPAGPWTMRVTNEDTIPVRIPADQRLLRLDVTPPGEKRRVRCSLPYPLRPRSFPKDRALYLEPGQVYEERFDPRLFCFGAREARALVPGAVVHAFFGWARDPYAVEDLDKPSGTAPLRALAAPAVTIGRARAGIGLGPEEDRREPVAPPTATSEVLGEPQPDEKAPRLAIEAPRFREAASPNALVISVHAWNAGARPMYVVLRDRMIRVAVDGPTGPFTCAAPQRERDATSRQLFRTLASGQRVTLSARLAELCGNAVFRRPGLYRVTVTVRADESGEARGFAAWTGEARADRATLVRVLSAPEPFHVLPPEPADDEP
jgi:hypothetical protein